jgi:hypothetical protein
MEMRAMAITRVWIEEVATVIEGVDYSAFEEKIREAAKGCLVDVIKYEEA